jgi:hypothetical protein
MNYKINLCIALAVLCCQSLFADIFYVSTTGSDTNGDGSASKPWKTLRYAAAKVPPNANHTIQIGPGTFVESGQVRIPPGVNIEGSGKTTTILKATSAFYYYPETPSYATDKFLISLNAVSRSGNQSLRRFTIDGDEKRLHGGIYVHNRDRVTIDEVMIRNTNYNGLWLWDVKDSQIRNTDLVNCSWGSADYCVGALNLGNIVNLEIDRLNVDESVGYGIKAIGPSGTNNITNLKLHDSRISVNPYGLWQNGLAPNIAIELWQVNLVGCEIYNSYVDNTISLVNTDSPPSTGIQTIRVHHNTIDMETRAKGTGYGIELSIHDAEIDHNYFIKGTYGIANWDKARTNWNIHHNIFYALAGVYPGDILRSQHNGLHNVNFYNNTIEFTGDKTMNVVGLYGGASKNLNLINNLIINNNTAYSYYPNALIHMENGSVLSDLVVRNNLFDSLATGTVSGSYSGNLSRDPKINAKGERPDPYYQPVPASPLLDAGLRDLPGFPGMTDDIGAFEFNASLFNEAPDVRIGSAENKSTFYAGATVTLTAEVVDSTGNIDHVRFLDGSRELYKDTTAPYSFSAADVPAGEYDFRAIAMDNFGASDTSHTLGISVLPWIRQSLYASEASLSGNMTLSTDSTAATSYFSIPSGYGTNYTLGASAAQFNFNVDSTDQYIAWVRVRTHGAEHQGYSVYDGKGNWTTWFAGTQEGWTWTRITDAYTGAVVTFPFTKGANLLVFSWLHDDVYVEEVIVTNNPDFMPAAKTGSAAARTTTTALSNPLLGPAKPEQGKTIILYPNPIKADFTVSYESPVSQEAEVKITTLTSHVMTSQTVDLTPGANTIHLSSDHLTNGIYFISVVTATGETFEIKAAVSK